nr:hypothetical protein [Tanacetum cinerariifolium]
KALAMLADSDIEATHLANGTNGIYSHFKSWDRWLGAPEKAVPVSRLAAERAEQAGGGNQPRAQCGADFGVQPAHRGHRAHRAGAVYLRAAGREIPPFAD